jgi:hypothetical protein
MYPVEISMLAFNAGASLSMDAGGKAEARVEVLIDPQQVAFRTVEFRHKARLHVAVFCLARQGGEVGSGWSTMDLDLLDEAYGRAMREGIRYQTLVPLEAPAQVLKVVVYDPAGGRIGSRILRIQ